MFGKSICCLLCRASILFFDASGATKFARHMQFEHGAMHDLEFMLAACKMNESEKKALVEVFNKPSEKVEVKNTSVCKKEHKDTILVDSKHKANNTNLPVVGNMKATNVSLDKENTDQKEKHVKDGTAKVKVSKESSDVNFKDKTKKKKKLAIESDEKIKRDNIEMKKPENIVQRQKKEKTGTPKKNVDIGIQDNLDNSDIKRLKSYEKTKVDGKEKNQKTKKHSIEEIAIEKKNKTDILIKPITAETKETTENLKDELKKDDPLDKGTLERKARGKRIRNLDDAFDMDPVVLEDIVKSLIKHVDGWPFDRPVTKAEAPDYHLCVKNPMDLETIRSRLNDMFYTNNQGVINDIRLVFNNCFYYNRSDTEEYGCAERLETYFESQLKAVGLVDDESFKQLSKKRTIGV